MRVYDGDPGDESDHEKRLHRVEQDLNGSIAEALAGELVADLEEYLRRWAVVDERYPRAA